MGNDTSGTGKDDPGQEDSLLKLNNDVNLSAKDGFLKLQSSLCQKNPQHLFVSSTGKWLQIAKNRHKGSFFRGTDSKIPRHVVSPDEKFLRHCLELIHISASKYHFEATVIPKENTRDVPRAVFELPSEGDSGSTLISPAVAVYKSVMHMLDKPLLRNFGALDIDPNGTGRRRKDEMKGSVSCELASSLSSYLMPDSHIRDYRSKNVCEEVVTDSSTGSTCFSSEPSSSSSSSTTISQGTLRFTMNGNGLPRFVFSLDDQKEIFVASLSNAESGFNSGALEHIYLIHLQRGSGSGSGSESHLVGKLKVSTLCSVSSSSNSRITKREFVLFSDGGNLQMQCHDSRKSKGFPKKVVDAFNTRASRQRSISRFSRAGSTSDLCSWEPFQEPGYDHEPVNLLENDLPPNLESSAVVVEEQHPQEQHGGWGMKFLKKTPLARTHDSSEPSTSVDFIIPSGIHGGPRKRNGGPSSLIQRWKSGGICDCGGWDLGCPVTILKGQPRKDQSKLLELFTEGSNHGTPGLRIVNIQDGLYLVQSQPKISDLQSFSVAIAYIHCQSQSQRLMPLQAGNCTKALS